MKLHLRLFLALGLNLFSLSPANAQQLGVSVRKRPNILFILTDQQHAGMLSCSGNPHVKTPALDGLASNGIRFERAYCANPVCVPSRFSMLTGVMPSRIGIESNVGESNVPSDVLVSALGKPFQAAGYLTVYGGKLHTPMKFETLGFDQRILDERRGLADECVTFLKRPHRQPFFLVASFINPHDICYMRLNERKERDPQSKDASQKSNKHSELEEAMALPPGVSEKEFYAHICPPLPPNFEIPEGEPAAVATGRLAWSDERWRLHRWAYARLTEHVDGLIGKVLAALKEAGLEKDTLVVFTSDHGEMDGAHRLEHKSKCYEEAARVPFILSWKDVIPAGQVDRTHLLSTGLDLIPTLCDFAGIPIPPQLKGRSLKPLADGNDQAPPWRETLVMENAGSRMLRSNRYKYVVYGKGALREQLMDLESDPGEMKNLALDKASAPLLEKHRHLLRQWYVEHDEKLDPKYMLKNP